MTKIALLLFIFAFSSLSARPQVVNEILKRMDAHGKALRSLRAEVTINKFSAQLGGTLIKEGTLKLLTVKNKPPVLRIDSTKPAPESFSVVGNRYALYLPERKTAYTGTTDDAGIVSMLVFLDMPKDSLLAVYNVRYVGEVKVVGTIPAWQLELTPKTAGNYKTVELRIDVNGMPLHLKFIEASGDWTSILLGNLQKNVVFKSTEFMVDLPKGTTLVKN
jgi:outer membrane lipoprotein-sorting protein